MVVGEKKGFLERLKEAFRRKLKPKEEGKK